jgi:hypothetical protein
MLLCTPTPFGCFNFYGCNAFAVSCNPGFASCDGNAANGCETPITTDTNCGACGIACAPNAHCSRGLCILRNPVP